jgi:hypothetical protein
MITVFGSQPRIPPPSTFARIEDWKGQGPVLGRAEAARLALSRRLAGGASNQANRTR